MVDVGALDFLDSTGVAVLVRLAGRFSFLEIRGANPTIRRLIEVLGLTEHLHLAGD